MGKVLRATAALLASRKFQVGVATITSEVVVVLGFTPNEPAIIALIAAIAGVGATIIAAIAYEDGKEKGS